MLHNVNENGVTNKPWGSYRVIEEGPNYKIKEITVLPGKRLSVQSHKLREEIWTPVRGEGILINLGNKKYSPEEILTSGRPFSAKQENIHGSVFYIDKNEIHSVKNTSKTELLVFIEVQKGICDEEDIVRYADDFGRVVV